jgi:hypothetical protein
MERFTALTLPSERDPLGGSIKRDDASVAASSVSIFDA